MSKYLRCFFFIVFSLFPLNGEYIKASLSEKTIEIEYSQKRKLPELTIPDIDINLFKIGKVTDGRYKGGHLILEKRVDIETHIIGKGETYDEKTYSFQRYILSEGELIFIKNISTNKTYSEELFNYFKSMYVPMDVDNEVTVPELESPDKIKDENERRVLKLKEKTDKKQDAKIYEKIFNHPKLGEVTINRETHEDFRVFRPDGTTAIYNNYYGYELKDVSWIDEDTDIRIEEYNSGLTKSVFDSFGDRYSEYDTIIKPGEINIENDLKVVGHDKNGDPVYTIKDKNHEVIQEFLGNYNKYYNRFQGQKLSADELYDKLPVLFWEDPFGRLHRYNKVELLPIFAAEPVIYLYPESTMEIDVSVEVPGGMTESIPLYNGGWSVKADSSSDIINLEDGISYPYLFWEGFSSVYPRREEGFLVETDNMSSFLNGVLGDLGLNSKEIDDFCKYWLSRLKDKPYCLISFVPQEDIDKLYPLEIEPEPDNVIRVLMDFMLLEEPIPVEEPTLDEPAERKGFVVVEWGGIIR